MNISVEFQDEFDSSTIYSVSPGTFPFFPLVFMQMLTHYNFRKLKFHMELKRILNYSFSWERKFHWPTKWYKIMGINTLRWKIPPTTLFKHYEKFIDFDPMPEWYVFISHGIGIVFADLIEFTRGYKIIRNSQDNSPAFPIFSFRYFQK